MKRTLMNSLVALTALATLGGCNLAAPGVAKLASLHRTAPAAALNAGLQPGMGRIMIDIQNLQPKKAAAGQRSLLYKLNDIDKIEIKIEDENNFNNSVQEFTLERVDSGNGDIQFSAFNGGLGVQEDGSGAVADSNTHTFNSGPIPIGTYTVRATAMIGADTLDGSNDGVTPIGEATAINVPVTDGATATASLNMTLSSFAVQEGDIDITLNVMDGNP